MIEHNNREKAKKFAEYITGKVLRRYVADKVKKYVGDNPIVFDGACGSGQLEEFINPKKLVGCEIQSEAVEAVKVNFKDSDIYEGSFFNYKGEGVFDCVVMNPPFSLKFKDLSKEEQSNIQKEFPWKKSGVVDDIFILKSLKYTKRYAFYIAFGGIAYRKTETKLREIIGNRLAEFDYIENGFDDTGIAVLFIVIDKEKTSNKYYSEIYDCKAERIKGDESLTLNENRWERTSEVIEKEAIDQLELEIQRRDLGLNYIKSLLEYTQFICEFDSSLPPFEEFLNRVKKLVLDYVG